VRLARGACLLAALAAGCAPESNSTDPKAAAPAAKSAAQPLVFSMEWVPVPGAPNRMAVEVRGLDPALQKQIELADMTVEWWNRLLCVFADAPGAAAPAGLPPVLGTHTHERGVLRFTPQFPIEPGIRYRAVFDPAALGGRATKRDQKLTLVHFVPPRELTPTTVVSAVYPSAGVLPENLLKFYLHFSAPMSRGNIYEHIRLLDDAGKPVELPFLEIDEELWSPDRTRLTLFIDPGRIKRGVKPLEEIGPALVEGRNFTLVIARDWKDGAGTPLKEQFRKAFRVGPQDRTPPDPSKWGLEPPRADSRDPLIVSFNKPMDHALALRMIRVTAGGSDIAGEPQLSHFEQRWTFVPDRPWKPGLHKLVVQTLIEDLAGNNIGKPFEVDMFDRVERRLTTANVSREFEVK